MRGRRTRRNEAGIDLAGHSVWDGCRSGRDGSASGLLVRIINEAYAALEDGTATREDIDLGYMKLGHQLSMGPFEW